MVRRIESFLVLVLLALVCNGQVTITPSSYLTVNEGEDAEFSCSGYGPHLLQFNSNVTTPSRLSQSSTDDSSGNNDTTTVTYTMSTAARDDNGTTLQCFFNGMGSRLLTILVDFPPRYDPDEATFIVIEGSAPRFSMELNAFPEVTQYTWRKDGNIINSDNRVNLYADSMEFTRVARTDSGVYTVETNDGGQATISLIVYYAPVFSEGNSESLNRSVVLGRDITLSCGVMATPTAALVLSYNTEGTVSNIMINSDSFVITNAEMGNIGQYTCEATNDVGIRELTYMLTVEEIPSPSSTSSMPAGPSVTGPSVTASTTPSSSPGSGASAKLGNLLVIVLLLVTVWVLVGVPSV